VSSFAIGRFGKELARPGATGGWPVFARSFRWRDQREGLL